MSLKNNIAIGTLVGVLGGGIYEGTIPVKPVDSVMQNEDVSKRTENSIHFKTASPDTFKARIYAIRVNFKDADGKFRRIDKTIQNKAFLNKVISGYENEVASGIYNAEFPKKNEYDYRFSAGGASVAYEALFDTTNAVSIQVEPSYIGVKETITLKDDSAPQSLSWKLTVDGAITGNGAQGWQVWNAQANRAFVIQAITAQDATGKVIPVTSTLIDNKLTAVLDCKDAVFPVVVDPTSVTATNDGVVVNSDEVYDTARNAVTGSGTWNTTVQIGQVLSDNIYRSFFSFAIPDMSALTATSMFLEGNSDLSTTDFEIYIHTSTYSNPLVVEDFDLFAGHQASGAYNGTVLNNTWNSSSYSATWNEIVFNAAGIAVILAAKNATLKLAAISKEDYNDSAPGGSERIIFESSATAGKEPYLSITYTPPYSNPPTGFILHTPTTTSISSSWTNHHTTGIDSLRIFTGANAWVKTLTKTDTNTTITGLTPGTEYIFKARVDSSTICAYSNADTLSTLANPPSAWAFVEDFTDSTKITIGFGANSNPAATTFAIRDSTNQKWVGADGIADEAARVWQTKTQWTATASLINRNPQQNHRIGVVARNGDGIETAYIWGALSIGNIHLAQIASLINLTYASISGTYLNAKNTTNVDSISAGGETVNGMLIYDGTFGQGWINTTNPDSAYFVSRLNLAFVIPALDSVFADTLRVSGVADNSVNDFIIDMRPASWTSTDTLKSRYHKINAIGGETLLTGDPSTADYSATMNWIFSTLGRATIQAAQGDTVRLVLYSVYDKIATPPTVKEFITVSNPVLRMKYLSYENVPSGVNVTAVSTDSIYVTWLNDDCPSATRFRLVDAYTGIALGADDSTDAAELYKFYGGFSANTKHNIAIQVVGGKLDGEVSASQDSVYTKANTPDIPTQTFPTGTLMKFILAPNSNPSYTEFAVQDSISGKYVYAITGPDTLGTAAWWGTYAQFGAAAGDCVTVAIGKKYVLRSKARSGE